MEFYRWILILTGVSLLGIAYLMGRKTLQPSVYHRAKPEAYDPTLDELRVPISDQSAPDWQNAPNAQLEPQQASAESYSAAQNYQTDESFLTDEEIDAALPNNESYGLDPLQVEIDIREEFEDPNVMVDSESSNLAHHGQVTDDQPASFASVVKRVASEPDEQSFAKEFESYNEPVQLDEFEEKLVTVHVAASNDRRFYGSDLKALFEKHGYKFGRMSLYHCSLDGDKVFSIANMVKPGTFNEQEMDSFETPGFTLFMRLPIELKADVAFDFLIREATELADELGGQLRDGKRNPLSEQTIQHMREDIQQYLFRSKQCMQNS